MTPEIKGKKHEETNERDKGKYNLKWARAILLVKPGLALVPLLSPSPLGSLLTSPMQPVLVSLRDSKAAPIAFSFHRCLQPQPFLAIVALI